jgi:hypothetical protein
VSQKRYCDARNTRIGYSGSVAWKSGCVSAVERGLFIDTRRGVAAMPFTLSYVALGAMWFSYLAWMVDALGRY